MVESNDFTKAKDRLCFTVSANDLTTLWATEAWEKISGISGPAHNEDKNELTASDKVVKHFIININGFNNIHVHSR